MKEIWLSEISATKGVHREYECYIKMENGNQQSGGQYRQQNQNNFESERGNHGNIG